MSSIEKAVNKLRAKKVKEVDSRAEPWSGENSKTDEHKHRTSERGGVNKYQSPELPREEKTVTLDLVRLKAAGMLLPDSVPSQMLEEYRNIKRPLLKNAFSQGATHVEHGNLIMITSALPGEGKTFTAINLAMSIAMELDRTILLVDADVSRAGISSILGFDAGKGLSDLLIDSSLTVSDVLIKTNIPKLRLMSAGQHCENINELMASSNMAGLIDDLSHRYSDRVILFDSPPLIATTEARILAGHMGQILMVVEAEKTSQSVLQEAIDYLDSSKVIGLVLNKNRSSFVFGYGYGYGYGYGGRNA